MPLKVLDLFSGIGGFSLGLEAAGMQTIAFCESDPVCRQVLRKHWSEVPIHDDICALDATKYRGQVDVICGGFPCQDISFMNQSWEGLDGERSSLWYEMARCVGEVRPKLVIAENLPALLVRGFDRVLSSLADLGYDAEWDCIPASRIGACHQRSRLFIFAYPSEFSMGQQSVDEEQGNHIHGGIHRQAAADTESQNDWIGDTGEAGRHQSESGEGAGREGVPADTSGERLERQQSSILQERQIAAGYSRSSGWWETEPSVRRVDDGSPRSMDRLRMLGNAVVPQVVELLGHSAIEWLNRRESWSTRGHHRESV